METPPSHHPRRSHQLWVASPVLLTAAVPLIALIVWLGYTRANPRLFDTFAGEKIGGRLSQAQAKAIDVATGAVLAPLFMASVNHVWFESARVSVVNERSGSGSGSGRAVPLRTLVAASSTSGGSYDLLTLRALLQGKTFRLFLFALLSLLSAVSRSALGNVIAYEAYSEQNASPSNTLRLQRDITIDASFAPSNAARRVTLDLYDFTPSQNAQVAKQMVALLTELRFENAAPRLTDRTYVGINATSQSLDALPLTVMALDDVPAYRLSVDCSPNLPTSIGVLQPLSRVDTQISLILNTTVTSNNTLFQANYPGVPEDIQTGDGDGYSYAAFSLGSLEAYLGHLNRFNLTNQTLPSIYGNVSYRAFNMSATPSSGKGFTGTQTIMSVSGIRCSLFREHGLLNYTRAAGTNDSTSSWTIASIHFPDNQEKVNIPSMLTQFQTSLNFHAPGAFIGGLGPALSNSVSGSQGATVATDSFTDFALNFLYASGEAQRILYEVAASNKSADHNPPGFFVDITGQMTREHYRITYVPSILLLGLLCLLGASMVTGSMAMYVRKTESARAHRQVDVVRLLVDSMAGLREDHKELTRLARGGNRELDAWADGYKVRYSEVSDDDGTVQIVLEKQ
ncbi:hypothetical protein BJ875DRAFT_372457 [Amylocarpus encephaloides]|uniref:Uncharacterized protein n=1 Tax=Amylocarpus encephaloides TaxID=45428 RepID=A0A9P7YNH8_9HELO|nr:hypothetical protein BJ875DRAFT_372457 [Amylocarpus encephaloides]